MAVLKYQVDKFDRNNDKQWHLNIWEDDVGITSSGQICLQDVKEIAKIAQALGVDVSKFQD